MVEFRLFVSCCEPLLSIYPDRTSSHNSFAVQRCAGVLACLAKECTSVHFDVGGVDTPGAFDCGSRRCVIPHLIGQSVWPQGCVSSQVSLL
jgi:hypothetical protein